MARKLLLGSILGDLLSGWTVAVDSGDLSSGVEFCSEWWREPLPVFCAGWRGSVEDDVSIAARFCCERRINSFAAPIPL